MIDKEELRRYLINDTRHVEKLLTYLGFHNFNYNQRGYLRCALPEKDNNSAVAINIDTLYTNIFIAPTYQGDFYGMLIHYQKYFGKGYKWNFPKVLKTITEILRMDENELRSRITQVNNTFTTKQEVEVIRNLQTDIIYELTYLEQFVQIPHIDLYNDGIMPQTQEKYNVWYSLENQRIVIPHFKYNDKTKIVGLQGRTTVKEYDKFLIPKYTNLIEGFRKSENLYGLSHNIKDIAERKQLIIFEGEKSVMKLDTFTKQKSFGVALGGSCLSSFQADLIGRLSKRIDGLEVIVALDKDVKEEVTLDMCKKLSEKGCKSVRYVTDGEEVLSEKDSPVDKGYRAFWKLFASRKAYEKCI